MGSQSYLTNLTQSVDRKSCLENMKKQSSLLKKKKKKDNSKIIAGAILAAGNFEETLYFP